VSRGIVEDKIGLKHGAGGRAMRALIEQVCLPGLAGGAAAGGIGLAAMDDGAAIPVGGRWLIVTTDSHVVHPIFSRAATSGGSLSPARSTTWP